MLCAVIHCRQGRRRVLAVLASLPEACILADRKASEIEGGSVEVKIGPYALPKPERPPCEKKPAPPPSGPEAEELADQIDRILGRERAEESEPDSEPVKGSEWEAYFKRRGGAAHIKRSNGNWTSFARQTRVRLPDAYSTAVLRARG